MPQDIAPIVAVAQDPAATSAEIDAALNQARAASTEAEAARAKADRAYQDGLIALDDKALAKLATERTAAEVRRDRTMALIAKLETSLAEAKAGETEAMRSAAHSAALAQRDAAAARIAEEYPRLVALGLDLLRAIAEADDAVQAANKDLPAGAQPLLGTEMIARAIPGLPREMIADVEMPMWCPEDSGEPAPEELQGRIVRQGDGKGQHVTSTGRLHYDRRIFRRASFRPAVPARYATPLSATLMLPALKPGAALEWMPEPIAHQAPSPMSVLARLARIEQAAMVEPVNAPRGVQVEFIPVSAPELARRDREHVQDWTKRLGNNMNALFQPIDVERDPETAGVAA